MSDLLAHFHVSERTPLQAHHSTNQTRFYFSIHILYSCNLPETKDTSAVKHKIAVCIPLVRQIATQKQFETCIVTDLRLCPKCNQPERPSAIKQHTLLADVHPMLHARPEKLKKMLSSLDRACPFPRGIPLLKTSDSKLNQVLRTCTLSLSLSLILYHCTASVLVSQRWNINAFSYTCHAELLPEVVERLYAGHVTIFLRPFEEIVEPEPQMSAFRKNIFRPTGTGSIRTMDLEPFQKEKPSTNWIRFCHLQQLSSIEEWGNNIATP